MQRRMGSKGFFYRAVEQHHSNAINPQSMLIWKSHNNNRLTPKAAKRRPASRNTWEG